MILIAEALREINRGVTPTECALRCRSRSGAKRLLNAAQERVCCTVYGRGEATLYELASVYRVSPRTMRRILLRGGVWKPRQTHTRIARTVVHPV